MNDTLLYLNEKLNLTISNINKNILYLVEFKKHIIIKTFITILPITNNSIILISQEYYKFVQTIWV